MEKKISKIVRDLHIPEHFPDYDINLLYLAFMPKDVKYKRGAVYDALKSLHPSNKDLSYDVLEFYGDEVLYMIIVEIFREFNGTRNTLFFLDKVKKEVTTNIYLRQLSHDLNICDTVYDISPTKSLAQHNHCSDSFEALLGALYVQYGLTGLDRIMRWFIETFPRVLNDVRKSLAPYIYVPVRDVNTDTTDLIARFEILNPRCKIRDADGTYTMYIDGLQYDSKSVLDDLIPIIYDGKLEDMWLDMRYSPALIDDERYICTRPPVKYNCDATLTNRISQYNTRVKSCKPQPASGACNMLSDEP